MVHTHFFQYNIPAGNHLNGHTNGYIDIRATFSGAYYDGDKPLVYVEPVNVRFYECVIVKDWLQLKKDVEEIATNHFAKLAKELKLAEARAVLINEGESGNPIMDYYVQHNALS